MKRCLYIFFHFIFFSSIIFAQEESSTKTTEISVAGGISYPSLPREFKDYWKKGINVSGGIGYSSQPGSLGYSALSLDLTYNNFSFDENGFRNSLDTSKRSVTLSGEATKIFTAMLMYRGTFSTTKQSVAPYFLLGVGYFYLSSGSVNVPSDTALGIGGGSQSSIAWALGAGAEAPINDTYSIFLEGKFVLGATGDAVGRQYYPVSIGVRIKP